MARTTYSLAILLRLALIAVAGLAGEAAFADPPNGDAFDEMNAVVTARGTSSPIEDEDESPADLASSAKYREVEQIFEQVRFEQLANEDADTTTDSQRIGTNKAAQRGPERAKPKAADASKPSGDPIDIEGEEQGSLSFIRHRWEEGSFDWVFRSGGNGLGMFSMRSAATRDLDFNDPSNFDIEFEFSLHFLSGPLKADMPARLYDLYFNVHWLQQLGDGFGVDANFDLGLFTDFEDSVREGWRYPGRALAFWNLNGEEQEDVLTLLGGIEFFDTDRARVVPAGGLVLQPSDNFRLELYFPRPAVKWRVSHDESSDSWFYVRGDFQSSAWAIERSTGNADVATLSEKRFAIGMETRSLKKKGETSFMEIGYVFDRELRYRSTVGDIDPSSSMMFRFGSRY